MDLLIVVSLEPSPVPDTWNIFSRVLLSPLVCLVTHLVIYSVIYQTCIECLL